MGKIKFNKKIFLFLLLIVVSLVFYVVNVEKVVSDIEVDAKTQEDKINSFIVKMSSISEVLIIYAEDFLLNDDPTRDAKYMPYLVYDEETGMYVMDIPGETPDDAVSVGGLESIPTETLASQELNMAISMGRIFNHFCKTWSEISRIYYGSEKGFMAMNPYISSESYDFKGEYIEMPFYEVASPENNPNGEIVWSPLYYNGVDGKPTLTLSQPLYYGDEFLGIFGIDFSTETFNESFTTQYDCYIVNKYGQFVGTNTDFDISEEIKTVEEVWGITSEEVIAEVDDDSGIVLYNLTVVAPFELGKTDYFYGFITVPLGSILVDGFVQTIPIIIVGVVLLYLFFMLEKRHKKISDLEKNKNELVVQTIIDPLTSVYNRRKFEEEMIEKINSNSTSHFYLAILDLDHFKNINDKYGHIVGDQVLIDFSKLLIAHLIEHEECGVRYARIGGEEFAIIFPDFDEEKIKVICETLREKVERYNFEINVGVTISVGVAKITTGSDFNFGFKEADNKLYEAKIAGRNKVLYDF